VHQIGKEEAGGATVVIGEVVQFHMCKQAWNQGRILSGELRAVGRIGGAQYSLVENAFELPRPSREARLSGDGHSPHVRKP
jgi:flavin reductase (DIM6/NTAB) family NADH-FMN oxidoreductase RutF